MPEDSLGVDGRPQNSGQRPIESTSEPNLPYRFFNFAGDKSAVNTKSDLSQLPSTEPSLPLPWLDYKGVKFVAPEDVVNTTQKLSQPPSTEPKPPLDFLDYQGVRFAVPPEQAVVGNYDVVQKSDVFTIEKTPSKDEYLRLLGKSPWLAPIYALDEAMKTNPEIKQWADQVCELLLISLKLGRETKAKIDQSVADFKAEVSRLSDPHHH